MEIEAIGRTDHAAFNIYKGLMHRNQKLPIGAKITLRNGMYGSNGYCTQ